MKNNGKVDTFKNHLKITIVWYSVFHRFKPDFLWQLDLDHKPIFATAPAAFKITLVSKSGQNRLKIITKD
jgi:hypothetical protein